MGWRDDTRVGVRPLPEHREIDAEEVADTAQGVLDLAVHLLWMQVDELGGEFGDHRIEIEKAPDVFSGARRLIE